MESPIKQVLESRNMSQAEAARLLGVRRDVVCRIVNGERKATQHLLNKMRKVLKLTDAELGAYIDYWVD